MPSIQNVETKIVNSVESENINFRLLSLPIYMVVQFRNFVVHRYESVDVEILADVVNNRYPKNSSSRFKGSGFQPSQATA